MPKWTIHRKWCKKLGIADEVCRAVDEIIDFGFKGHDDRSYAQRVFFFIKANESYRINGWDGIKAFFLHHTMDYIEYYIKSFAKEMGWPADENLIERITRWMKNRIVTHVKYYKLYDWRNYTIRGKEDSEVIEFLLDMLNESIDDVFEVERVNGDVIIKFSKNVWYTVEEVAIFVETNFWEIVRDVLK